MPSVNVWWTGRCADHAVQERLLRHLEKLADLSYALADHRPAPEHFRGALKGKILISPDVLGEPEQLSAEACSRQGFDWTSLGAEEVTDVERRMMGAVFGEEEGARMISEETERQMQEHVVVVERVEVRGLQFQLCLPYPPGSTPDTVSFVFLRVPEFKALDGAVVQVDDADECRLYKREFIRGADWFLGRPTVELRYVFERWMDRFLAWVKYFYFSDLHYCRYFDLPGYDELAAEFDRLAGSGHADRERLASWVFTDLLKRFRAEARQAFG